MYANLNSATDDDKKFSKKSFSSSNGYLSSNLPMLRETLTFIREQHIFCSVQHISRIC